VAKKANCWKRKKTYGDTGHQRLLPTVRITSHHGELFSTGMVNYTTRDEETGKYKGKPKSAYMQLGRECFLESGGKFIAYLSGRISKHYDEDGEELPLAGARWSDDHPDTDDIQPYQKFGLFEDDDEDWFVYNSTGPVMENFRFNKVPVKTIQAYQQNYNEDFTEQGAVRSHQLNNLCISLGCTSVHRWTNIFQNQKRSKCWVMSFS